RVVPETLLLLVSRLVLLVDDYEPERAHRREDGRARADDDARLAPDDARPLRPALAWTEAAVEDRCAVAEATPHALDELVSERDLRDEHDDVALGGERGLGSGEEHLGLPAPGDAVEEEGPRLAGRHGGRDRVGRRALRGGERRPRRWRRRLRVAHIDPRAYVDRDDAGADEPVEDAGTDARAARRRRRQLAVRRRGERAVRAGTRRRTTRERGLLLRREPPHEPHHAFARRLGQSRRHDR